MVGSDDSFPFILWSLFRVDIRSFSGSFLVTFHPTSSSRPGASPPGYLDRLCTFTATCLPTCARAEGILAEFKKVDKQLANFDTLGQTLLVHFFIYGVGKKELKRYWKKSHPRVGRDLRSGDRSEELEFQNVWEKVYVYISPKKTPGKRHIFYCTVI